MEKKNWYKFLDTSRNLFKFVLVVLSASVERVGVSRMRDFFITYLFLLSCVNVNHFTTFPANMMNLFV